MNQKLEITLLDRTMTVACPQGQADALLNSAQTLSQKMAEIRAKSPTTSLLNIALMAALNISNELISQQEQQRELEQHLTALSQTIEQAIQSQPE